MLLTLASYCGLCPDLRYCSLTRELGLLVQVFDRGPGVPPLGPWHSYNF